MKLLLQALTKSVTGFLLIALMLFLPAGTFHFARAWILIAVLFVPMLIMGAFLLIKKPALLQKRLNTKEKENDQKTVVLLSALQFVAMFVLAGLDYRFGWSRFPAWLTLAAVVLFLSAYGLYCEVIRENEFLSRTVEVQENQKVVDTGLYGIVRHPMYFSTILLFWSIPLVLGSWISFLVMLPFPLTLVKRIKNEEEVLAQGLSGYKAYMQKVKYRILPFIW